MRAMYAPRPVSRMKVKGRKSQLEGPAQVQAQARLRTVGNKGEIRLESKCQMNVFNLSPKGSSKPLENFKRTIRFPFKAILLSALKKIDWRQAALEELRTVKGAAEAIKASYRVTE